MSPPTRVNAGGASAGGVGHSSTSAGSAQDLFHALHPRRLIPELCHLFYHQGWFSGTGGGVSIKQGSNIYVAPSGVQKERLEHDDLFLLKGDGSIAQSPPQEKNLSLSQCTPLFMNAYQERNANAVIHSHGKYIVLASLIYTGPEFRIKNLEMIKGIHHPLENRAFRYDEEIIVPIIENTCFEADLKDAMLDAMKRYPTSNAVMVRRHGIYVWGKSWQQCKAMAECYHYLCEMAVEMERLGINEYTHHNEAIVPMVLSKPITPVTPKAESTPAPNSTATVPDTPKTPVAKDNGTTSNGTPNNKPAASPKKTPNTEGKAKLNGVKGGKVTKPKNNKQQGNKWNNRKSPAGARGGPGGPGGSGGPQMGGVPSPWGPPIPGLMGMGPMMGPMGPMMPPHPGMFGPGGPPSGGQNSGGRNGRGGGRGGGSGRGRGSKKQGGATTPKNTNDKNKTPNQRGGGAKGRGRGNKLGMSKNTIMNY